jgi:hypothetical protein
LNDESTQSLADFLPSCPAGARRDARAGPGSSVAAASPQRASTGPHEGFGIQLGGGPIFSSFDDTAGLDFDTKAGWLAGLLMGGNRGGLLGVEVLRFSVQARLMRGLKEISKDLVSAQDSKSKGFVVLVAFPVELKPRHG